MRWIGRQTIASHFSDELRLPILIKAEALGKNMPCRDLMVSPDHALFVDNVLIQAGALVNGTSIVRERNVPAVFTYYHVEVDDHSLILAENTPAETFVDNVDRANFDNWHEYEALYPEGKAVLELAYPRAKAAGKCRARSGKDWTRAGLSSTERRSLQWPDRDIAGLKRSAAIIYATALSSKPYFRKRTYRR